MTQGLARGAWALLAATALTTVGAGAAHADSYDFADDCGAQDILNASPDCSASIIDVTVDGSGNVELAQVTAYPLVAFDEFLTTVEQWSGTTEEYLEDALLGIPPEPGTSYDYVLDDNVEISVVIALRHDSGDAEFMGFSLDGEHIVANVPSTNVVGLDRFSITTPGNITDSNGRVEGNTVSWDSDQILESSVLTARGDREPSASGNSWLVALIPVGALFILAGIYFGFIRKPGTPHVDLEPEFLDADAAMGETDTPGSR